MPSVTESKLQPKVAITLHELNLALNLHLDLNSYVHSYVYLHLHIDSFHYLDLHLTLRSFTLSYTLHFIQCLVHSYLIPYYLDISPIAS